MPFHTLFPRLLALVCLQVLLFDPAASRKPPIKWSGFTKLKRECPTGELYHPVEKKCYPEGPGGPCPETQAFVIDNIAVEQYLAEHDEFAPIGKCECAKAVSQYPCRHLPVLQSEADNRCYEIYTQGPCSSQEWFTPSKYVVNNRTFYNGVCSRNPCDSGSSSRASYADGSSVGSGRFYLYNERCYQTNTRAHCLDPDQVSYFAENYPLPYCGESKEVFGNCVRAPQCKEEEFYHEATKSCYKKFSQGPCPETMVLGYPDLSRSASYRWQFGDFVEFAKCDCRTNAAPSSCAHRPYLYSGSDQRCYPAFSQGPCKANQWFRGEAPSEPGFRAAPDRLQQGFCAPNDCLKPGAAPNVKNTVIKYGSNAFYFGTAPDTCFLTGTRGFCDEKKEVLVFENGLDSPSCAPAERLDPGCSRDQGPPSRTLITKAGCKSGLMKHWRPCGSTRHGLDLI